MATVTNPAGTVVARLEHNRYNGGWAAAYGKVSLPTTSSTAASFSIETPPATVDGNADTTTYTMNNAQKNVATVTNPAGTVVARLEHNRYNGGWNAAYAKVSIPGTNTTTASFDVSVPPSTVDGTAETHTYTISNDDVNIVKVMDGNTVVARFQHAKWQEGWNAAVSNLYANATATKTLAYGESAYVLITYVDSSGTTQTYLERTYTAPPNNAGGLSLDATNKKIIWSSSSSVQEYTISLDTGTWDSGSRTVAVNATSNTEFRLYTETITDSLSLNVTERTPTVGTDFFVNASTGSGLSDAYQVYMGQIGETVYVSTGNWPGQSGASYKAQISISPSYTSVYTSGATNTWFYDLTALGISTAGMTEGSLIAGHKIGLGYTPYAGGNMVYRPYYWTVPDSGGSGGGGESSVTISIDDINATNSPPSGQTATNMGRQIATAIRDGYDFVTFRVNAGGVSKRYNIEMP